MTAAKMSVLVIALVLTALSGLSFAEESIEFGVSADFYSKYIWRGQNLNEDYAFQPGVSVSYAGLTAAVWPIASRSVSAYLMATDGKTNGCLGSE